MPYNDTNDNYDADPVLYCSRCYSLKIKYEEAIDSDCCMDCGCSDISESSIEEWEKLYEKRYGEKYVKRNYNPRNTLIFKMSLEELKTALFNNSEWRTIIESLYPKFPRCYSRTDSIILLFDKLCKDSRIDDLKFLLLKYSKSQKNGRAEEKHENRSTEELRDEE